ncbi:MAG: divergent PAP2 family protein [Candidatus Woesearchaeota archaeon]
MNPTIIILFPLVSWLVSQLLKNIVFWFSERKISAKYLLTDGGIPSSHSAVMTSLTIGIYLVEGFSPVFYLSGIVSLIVFRDAFGVRLESSKQAKVLNELLAKEHSHKVLSELIGHTKKQVFAGILTGVFVSLILLSIL